DRRARWGALLFRLACAAPAHAATRKSTGGVEFPASTRDYVGTLGTKGIELSLTRVDTVLSGVYCYQPCSDKSRSLLRLQGSVTGAKARIAETDLSGAQARQTGHWQLEVGEDELAGIWTAPDGKRSLPLHLRASPAFPFEIRVIADRRPANGECADPPHVSAVRLYQHGRLLQTLPTSSDGSCDIFVPNLVDVNFDGRPDLTIAEHMPAGPNMSYQTWLYDPARRRFVNAPASLQEITSPQFDSRHRTIVSSWRASCCEHGVTTYRWRGHDVEETATATSGLLAVLDGKRKLFCYTMPAYVDGHIEFPDRVEQDGERLRLTFTDLRDCDANLTMFREPQLTIWKRTGKGAPELLRTETVAWKPRQSASGPVVCPEVPFFAGGRIERIVLDDDPDTHCHPPEQ
ncbi:MAG: XAC2610-related protein, partial [Gammaproteobacteria bacterium]